MEFDSTACPLTRGERILVGLDGSEASEAAFDQAISMARICNSRLFAVSVIDILPERLQYAPQLDVELGDKARAILEKAKDKAEKAGIPCQTFIHTGDRIHEFIIQEAKENEVDLIVIGTHGRTGLSKLLMGSVAQRVIGYAPCPVLVTPSRSLLK